MLGAALNDAMRFPTTTLVMLLEKMSLGATIQQIGCYGCKTIETPNLDRLAVSGTRFGMAFARTASCSGSWIVIYTGLHTHETGSYGLSHGKNRFQTFENVESAPFLFNKIGYKTGNLGKVHAEEFFKSSSLEQKPFFLTVGFVDPHRQIQTRGGFGNVDGNHDPRLSDIDVSPKDVEIPIFLSDIPEVRQDMAEYYKAIHRMDQGVGRILDALERTGAADTTLVLFLSDNGPPFINSKTTLFEAGVQLPFLMRALGRSMLPIAHCKELQPSWDCVFRSHTFHEITNYRPTRYMSDSRYNSQSMISPRRLKDYICRPPEELCDLEQDPVEVRNLADNLEYGESIKLMRNALEEWQLETSDLWLWRDGAPLVRYMSTNYAREGLCIPDRFDFEVDKPRMDAAPSVRPWKVQLRSRSLGDSGLGKNLLRRNGGLDGRMFCQN
ncbi:alkaline-phosphatase-like protein [Ilyonectria destructans]|nr:alkaline-phosphatase-like protein [Ilyonectria destructans]